MPTCNVTGIVYLPSGDPLVECEVAFKPREINITDWVIGAVVPKPVKVLTDATGFVDVDLVPGAYVMIVRDWHGWANVPDAVSATVADILDMAIPPEPIPAWLAEAKQARDEAVAAADQAETAAASLDVQVFTTYAAALAYSTANPLAMVFSEEAAP